MWDSDAAYDNFMGRFSSRLAPVFADFAGVTAGERVPPSMVEDTVKQFMERMGLTFPGLLGDNTYDVQRTYSVYGLPSTFIINPDGTIVDYHNGMYPNEATLEAQIQKALGEETAVEN